MPQPAEITQFIFGRPLSFYLTAPKAPAPSPAPEAPTAPASNVPAVLQVLAWPAVSMVAILALFFITRQAITGGRNVEISWKVTEKITGRVVITKVRTRATKERATA